MLDCKSEVMSAGLSEMRTVSFDDKVNSAASVITTKSAMSKQTSSMHRRSIDLTIAFLPAIELAPSSRLASGDLVIMNVNSSINAMPLHSVLRATAASRPMLVTPASRALYHSYETPEQPPYRDAEARILSAAMVHVPRNGFNADTLTIGAKDAGYLDISTNLFPKGAFELVRYHLVTQRLGLKHRLQFSPDDKSGVGRRVRSLVLERLRANADADVVGRWQEALGIMSLAENIPASLKELSALSDEIWFLAGDTSVDSSWYTKRASLSAIYAATEVFQTTDQSTDFRDTEKFLDRRLEDLRVAGSAVGTTVQWLGFQGGAFVNLLRSKGVRV